MISTAETFPSIPPILTLRPSPIQIHKSTPPSPYGILPTLVGKQYQNRQRKEKLHVSQEIGGKGLEMKVE